MLGFELWVLNLKLRCRERIIGRTTSSIVAFNSVFRRLVAVISYGEMKIKCKIKCNDRVKMGVEPVPNCNKY
jgi:hypothetical protein